MKPELVSLSCDSNPYYLQFWEPVSRIWKHKFGIEPYLFYIGDPDTAPSNEHGKVVPVKPIHGVPIHTQAQWARFHFTQTQPDSVWITSDIDMFPLSRNYFIDTPKEVVSDCFVTLNSDMRNYFPVCYNMALGRVFKEVLQLEDTFEADVKKVFSVTTSDSHTVGNQVFENWSADERYSSAKICEYRSIYPHKVVQFMRPGGYQSARRIDRCNWQYNENAVKQGWYLDCHSLRPYSDYKQQIETLLRIVLP
jgi:hypothetical protein